MKKVLSILAVVISFLLVYVPVNYAQVFFPVSFTIPNASGVNVVATKYNSNGTEDPADDAYLGVVQNLNFDDGRFYDNTFEIWKSNIYFAIDFYNVGGGSTPSVQVRYIPNSDPNYDLGTKIIVTSVAGTTPLEKFYLGQYTSDYNLGYDPAVGDLRIFLGVNDGAVQQDGVTPVVPGSEVFTNADAPGPHSGTLVVTATPT